MKTRTWFVAAVAALSVAACAGGGKPAPASPETSAEWEITEEPLPAAEAPPAVPLQVTDMQPRGGAAGGGDTVTFTGASFLVEGAPRAVHVYFGDHEATDVAVVDDATFTVHAPDGPAATAVDVKIVFEPGGEITLPGAYAYAPAATAAAP